MKLFGRKPQQPATATPASQNSPSGLVSFVKQAAVSLEKTGASGERAAVYLVADHSGSMDNFYNNGSDRKSVV